ncbi:hypothetical protein I5E68_09935 [Novosphingobium sp. YJ-S2-02]|uniref:Uncharacterized protein n=1 Tax=Novosphingobium aureum TaxID=2792964 RepID=A0A931HC14_9SPHN|nr:hypothetical protein [Novosphingobium aureum]MBH0113265.1 hypothetical protein [Novosphingobium aureum]
MGLRNLTLPTKQVQVADGVSFTVRGLAPYDALGLYYRHTGELSALFDKLALKGSVEPGDVSAVTTVAVSAAPRVMAEIIVVAEGTDPSDEVFEEEVRAALKLPAAAQMDALGKIADLTFTSEMPPKKFLAVVLALAQGAAANLPAKPQT